MTFKIVVGMFQKIILSIYIYWSFFYNGQRIYIFLPDTEAGDSKELCRASGPRKDMC